MSDEQPATKGDVRSIVVDAFNEMREMIRPITVALARHDAELAAIRGYLKANMVTRDEFHSRMDGFTGRVEDFDYSAAKNRVRLDDHEKRIAALEKKPA